MEKPPLKTIQVPTTRYDILSLFLPGPLVGVEIGTDTGINARELLLSRPYLFLWTVDPWQATREFPEEGRGTALHFYQERVGEFVNAARTRHLRMTSVEAAAWMAQEMAAGRTKPPDFVYVDGDHSAEAVHTDLHAWWPLLRQGGLMAGHDFEAPEVHTPVIQFARDNRLELVVLNEHGDPDIVPQELRGPKWTPGHGFDRWGGWAHPSFLLWKE